MNIAKFLTYSTSVIALLVLLAAPTHAQGAKEQLEAVAQSSQEAADATTVEATPPEEVRVTASEGFDTPVDPDADVKLDCKLEDCVVDPCVLAPERCNPPGGGPIPIKE